jgi:L-iditol 2-dehydrogenase
MKGVYFLGERQADVKTVPDPEAGPGEVVIEMRSAGLCGSDLHHFRAAPADVPTVIVGHEACGVVVEVGDGVNGVAPGTRVVVNHHHGCGLCLHCRIGSPKYCSGPHGTYGGTHDGADGDYMVAQATAVVPLPDALSFEDGAAAACGAGTAFTALARLQVSGRDTIAIFGQGPVGLTATLLAHAMGARVIAVDVVEERLALAAANGAAAVIDASAADAAEAVHALTAGRGADATLDCSGSSAGRVAALDAVDLRGRVCFVGVGPPTEFDVSEVIIGKELTCHGSWTFTTTGLIECMDFLAERAVPLANLVTHRFPLERAAEAFSLFDGGRTGKCMFVF